MIKGYASDAPKNDIPTSKASNWQRVKHKARTFRYRFA